MKIRYATVLLGSAALWTMAGSAMAAGEAGIQLDADDIGGVVTGAKGPEAGVWVVAETTDLPTRFAKIVVTDDRGRYVLPDLPKATYKIWVRGYGLVDSKPVESDPGKAINLTALAAPSAKAAAEYYPANYWSSLISVPAKSEFPGTGPSGNGIAPSMVTQQDWLAHVKEQCHFCHQLGTKITRELPNIGNSVEAWDQRVQKARSSDDPFHEGNPNYVMRGPGWASAMNNNMTRYGRQRGLQMFADWTDRIAKGELPPQPPRPAGVERNVVVSVWDWGGGRFIHDSSVSDKRNPTVGGGGPVYGVLQLSGMVVALDPKTNTVTEVKLNGLNGEWNPNLNDHTSTIDARGRYWMSHSANEGMNPAFCSDGATNAFAKFYPRNTKAGKTISVFDPKTQKNETIPVCFGTHHLNFNNSDRLYYSGDNEVVGWIDTKVWDETHDAKKAVGWCPLVLDTNGDGKITPDRAQWNQPEGLNVKMADPTKDTRIAGFNYANGVSPMDQSYWVAKYTPSIPSGIIRVDVGANPPETCRTEYYEAPKVNGEYTAFNARGVDVDSKGVAWVSFGSGSIAAFDRKKCKVLNGPSAIGQGCPEGWQIYDTPGPKLKGTTVGADWFYQTFVDHHNVSGLGKDTPIFPGSQSDEFLAFLPDKKQFVHMRVPYPLGFYPRGVDARIDDVNAGWKGRGLWASNAILTPWHQEGGEGSTETMVKVQIRPDPLAH